MLCTLLFRHPYHLFRLWEHSIAFSPIDGFLPMAFRRPMRQWAGHARLKTTHASTRQEVTLLLLTFEYSVKMWASGLCKSEKKIAFSASTACRESSLLTTWGLPSSQALFAQPTETDPIPCDTTWVLVVIDYSYLHEVASNLIPVEQSIWFLQVQRHFLGSQNLDKFDGYVYLYRGHSQMTSAERGRGKVPKFWCSKGGCVILVLQICPKCWQGGGGQKSRKFSWRHLWTAPYMQYSNLPYTRPSVANVGLLDVPAFAPTFVC